MEREDPRGVHPLPRAADDFRGRPPVGAPARGNLTVAPHAGRPRPERQGAHAGDDREPLRAHPGARPEPGRQLPARSAQPSGLHDPAGHRDHRGLRLHQAGAGQAGRAGREDRGHLFRHRHRALPSRRGRLGDPPRARARPAAVPDHPDRHAVLEGQRRRGGRGGEGHAAPRARPGALRRRPRRQGAGAAGAGRGARDRGRRVGVSLPRGHSGDSGRERRHRRRVVRGPRADRHAARIARRRDAGDRDRHRGQPGDRPARPHRTARAPARSGRAGRRAAGDRDGSGAREGDGTRRPGARGGEVLHRRQGRAHRGPLPAAPRPTPRMIRRVTTIYARLGGYLRPHWVWLAGGGLLALFVSAMDGAIAWLVKPAMDGIFIRRDLVMLKFLPLALLAVYVLKGLGRYGQSYLMAAVGERVIATIRRDLYRHIQRMPLAFFSDVHSAELTSRVIIDVNRLARLSSTVLVMALRQVGTIIALTAVMVSRDWVLTLFALFAFPFISVIVRAIGRRLYKINKRAQERVAQLVVLLQESFTGTKI